jgi:hypothetical protein
MEMEEKFNFTLFEEFSGGGGGDAEEIVDYDLSMTRDIACKINIILLSFGIIGNILCIFAFSRKKMIMRKFNWYLLILAIFELIFCVFLFAEYSLKMFHNTPMYLNQYINTAIDFTIHTIDTFIVLITLILSVDRLYAIKNPIKFKFFITNVHAKCLVMITLISSISLKTPCAILGYELFDGNLYLVYCNLVSPFIFNIIPTILILILNSLLVLQIVKYFRASSKQSIHLMIARARQPKNNMRVVNTSFSESNTKNKTSMKTFISNANQRPVKISQTQKSHYFVILVVAIWTVLTTMPYYSLNTYLLLFRLELFNNQSSDTKVIRIAQIISSIFFNSNHCINFFIYFRFYNEFKLSIMRPCSNARNFGSPKSYTLVNLQ